MRGLLCQAGTRSPTATRPERYYAGLAVGERSTRLVRDRLRSAESVAGLRNVDLA